jgi:hypothetical protein
MSHYPYAKTPESAKGPRRTQRRGPRSRPQAAELPLELVDELEELDEPEDEEDVAAAGFESDDFESDDFESEAVAPDVDAGELVDDDPRLSFR